MQKVTVVLFSGAGWYSGTGLTKKKNFYLQISLTASILAIFVVLTRETPDFVPYRWAIQQSILIFIGIGFSVLHYWRDRKKLSSEITIGIVHLLIFLIVGVAEGESVTVEILLLIVVAEDLAHLSDRTAFWVSLVLTALIANAVQVPTITWWESQEAPSTSSRILLILSFTGCLIPFRYHASVHRIKIEYTERYNAIQTKVMDLVKAGSAPNRFSSAPPAFINNRQAIVQEIHDSVSYSLVNIIAVMEAVQALSAKENIRSEIIEYQDKVKSQAIFSLRELRIILRGIRDRSRYTACNLLSLNQLIDQFRQSTDIRVRINFGNFPYIIKNDLFHVIYHIIQEGLTNAYKHGRAKHVDIYLWKDHNDYRIILSDDGDGCQKVENGLGFYGIIEQVRKFDGTFHHGSGKKGFEIRVVLKSPSL